MIEITQKFYQAKAKTVVHRWLSTLSLILAFCLGVTGNVMGQATTSWYTPVDNQALTGTSGTEYGNSGGTLTIDAAISRTGSKSVDGYYSGSNSVKNWWNINIGIVPGGATGRVHMIYWAKGYNASAYTSANLGLGYCLTTTPAKNAAASVTSSQTTLNTSTWTRVTTNCVAAKGTTYTYYAYPSFSYGGYYDDFVMYYDSTPGNATDIVAPTAGPDTFAGTTTLNWTNGTDALTGVQGTMILGTNTASPVSPAIGTNILHQGYYPSGATVTVSGTTWTVLGYSATAGNGTTGVSYTPGTTYTTYAFINYDKGYNYSPVTTYTPSLGTTPAPTLFAASGVTVDAPFDVTFTDDATWRAAAGTSVTVGGTALTAGYAITAGKITFTPSASVPAGLLQTAGAGKAIVISKTGYADATVNQTINAGVPAKLGMKTQPAALGGNGAALAPQPAVFIQDQYGNTTTSTATVAAVVGAGTWTLGGTASVAGVAGTATFSGLSATSAAAVPGATITFTSGALTAVTSGTFTIPAPVVPTITTSATLGNMSTAYGTASNSKNFTVSGTNMTEGILVTLPAGYEVSLNDTSFFSSLVVGAAGTISIKVYVRLAATTAVGNIAAGNIALTSSGAALVNVGMNSSVVNAKVLTITGLSGANKVYDGTVTASLNGAAAYSGLVNSETFSVTGTPAATFATATVGNGKAITVTGFTAPTTNYTVTQPTGLTANITKASQTITTFTAFGAHTYGDAAITLPATTDSGLTITYGSSNPAVATISGNTLTIVGAGTTTISASQAGNTNYAPLSLTYDLTVSDLEVTWNGTAWSNGTGPTNQIQALIAGDYSTADAPAGNGVFTAKKLTVNSGVLTVKSGTNLIIQNEVINNAAVTAVVVENNANLVQVNNTTNSGAITVNRNGNVLYRLDYTMWSSPVSGAQTLGDFSPLSSANPSRFYSYEADGYFAVSLPYSTVFGAGKGYLIRMPNEKPGSLGTNTQYYLVNETLEYKGVFTGTPNNGNVSLTGLTPEKFYSVGNPYPSTISAEAFLDNSNNNTGNVLYFWRKKNSDTGSSYATYTKGGATVTEPGITAPNGTIQVGQGFIVKTGVGASALNFTNAMRTSDNQNQFFRTKKAVEKNRVWLNLTSKTGVFSQALVGYMTDASQDVDAGIDGKYINDSKIALTSNINNEEYTIQGRSLPFDPSDVVPLNFKTDKAGDYTIAIDHTDGLFATGQDVYLVDSETGTETDLKAGSYTFTAPAGTANARFSLKYQKTLAVDAPAFNENGVTVYKNKAGLYVNSGVVTIANVKVYDIQGKLLVELKDVNATSATISSLKDTQQVLVVKVTAQDNSVVTKKIVN